MRLPAIRFWHDWASIAHNREVRREMGSTNHESRVTSHEYDPIPTPALPLKALKGRDQLRRRCKMTLHYLEDFEVGQKFGSGRLRIDEAGIKSFAAQFDPQPFHLDNEAARDSIFRGLAASGWHTAALTMR